MSDYLERERYTARQIWTLAHALIDDSPDALLLIDDSVQDKRYSRKIELVKRQYSGNEHGVVAGIGVVNLVHSSGAASDFYPIDDRIYAPDTDGKTKNDHFRDMLVAAIADKRLEARRVLFDSWYASADNLKLVHRAERIFSTTLKANRLVSLEQAEGYVHLADIDWTAERLAQGVQVRLQKVPFHVQLFKLVATNGDIDWVITNDPNAALNTQTVQDTNDVRWHVEELHRSLKQLTGTEHCQCRKARSQRNHIACWYHAWFSLKVHAKRLGKTLYQMRTDLFRDYLRAELANPHIRAI